MGLLHLDNSEIEAIKNIDEHELTKLIDDALRIQHVGELRSLPLSRCGSFVETRLRRYDQALNEYRGAKSSRKRDATEYEARRAGSDLSFAFSQMQHLVETEEREGQTFYVYDRLFAPYDLSNKMEVSVSYR